MRGTAAFCVAPVPHFTAAPSIPRSKYGAPGRVAPLGSALARCDWVSVPEPLTDWPQALPILFRLVARGRPPAGARAAEQRRKCLRWEDGEGRGAAGRALRDFGLLRVGGNRGGGDRCFARLSACRRWGFVSWMDTFFCGRKRDYDRFRDLLPSLIGTLRFREVGRAEVSRGLLYLVSDLSCPRRLLKIQPRESDVSLLGTHSMACAGGP